MSEDKTAQLVGIFKTLIRDNGMPQNIAEITDPEFLAFAEAHIDEFDEARDECETDRTLI
ncbi:hypothetical protein [Neorhizobium alkalisoli]|jgi:hypothetical protein|uniref:Uncharacterized protein n=1 Tax=Neorhizobium alkalisoli TaxID=528178 RepID=A0A561QJ56_9HYPH|nr:hypothetical protein [Neorhizobium alkalisoli]TWF50403.1 hypothetical protein FHW37_106367 [Neorhizobium alkalisoli]